MPLMAFYKYNHHKQKHKHLEANYSHIYLDCFDGNHRFEFQNLEDSKERQKELSIHFSYFYLINR